MENNDKTIRIDLTEGDTLGAFLTRIAERTKRAQPETPRESDMNENLPPGCTQDEIDRLTDDRFGDEFYDLSWDEEVDVPSYGPTEDEMDEDLLRSLEEDQECPF